MQLLMYRKQINDKDALVVLVLIIRIQKIERKSLQKIEYKFAMKDS